MFRHLFIPAIVCLISAASAADIAELERAVLRGDSLEKIEQIIKSGVDVNSKVEILPGYRVPLLCALVQDAVYQDESDTQALGLPYNAAQAAEMLLRNGADPNIRDHIGRTPLHFTSHALAQHYLLKAGADPKLADEDGNLPEVPEAEGIATEGAPTYTETDGMSPAQIRDLGVSYAEGRNDVLASLFPIGDNLMRALSVCSDENTKKGLEMVLASFYKVLESEGVEEIDPMGQPFDPSVAEAIMAMPAQEGEESGIVKMVHEKGYKKGEKILRYAKVVVTQ